MFGHLVFCQKAFFQKPPSCSLFKKEKKTLSKEEADTRTENSFESNNSI